MLISLEKLRAVFRKVQEIKEDDALYCLAPGKIPVSLDDLIFVLKQRYELEISIFEVVFEAEYLRGMMERSATNVSIYVRDSLSDEWQRFVVAKELGHVIIDEKEDWSTDVVETISGVVFDATFGREPSEEEEEQNDPPDSVQSEQLATIAAYELLFPRELRGAAIRQLGEGTTTIRKLALDFQIPDSIVSMVLSRRYMEIVDLVEKKDG